jgi:nitric oxide reductase large subunit
MMEILFQILEVLPLFFVLGYVVAATRAKDDIKEIKYILWALLFMLAGIADAII